MGGENVVTLACRCTNFDSINVTENVTENVDDEDSLISPDQQRRLDFLLDRKRLYTKAQALGGAPPSVVFQKSL